MDSQMTERPQARWVEVPTSDGGTRLEMRWARPPATATAAHAAHAA
jgi:hypothetical protein